MELVNCKWDGWTSLKLFFERLVAGWQPATFGFRACETLYPVQPGKVLVISEDNLSKEPQASQWAIFFPSVPITQEKWLWLLEDSTIWLLQKQEQYVF